MNIYQKVTDKVVGLLAQGVVPWHKPWAGGGSPANLISGKAYRGINPLLLASAGYMAPQWLTYRQAKGLGGNVRKGEKGMPVVFWKVLDKEAESGRRPFVARGYTVFNIEQCELPEDKRPPAAAPPRDNPPIEAAEAVVQGFKGRPKVVHGGGRACYQWVRDKVSMPPVDAFEDSAAYYAVLFHEFGHATGHPKRLDRASMKAASVGGEHAYSVEELVAEMTSAFVCGEAGIDPGGRLIENTAAYCESWIRRLRGDSKLLVQAGQQAAKAADHILGRSYGEAASK